MMCYLVHHLAQDVWTFAFWDGDLATAEHVRHAYQRMKETFYLGDKVKFRPDSNYQEAVAKTLTDVPVVFNDQLYQAAPYQAFNKGTAIGMLRLVPPDVPEAELTFDPAEIVIIHAPLVRHHAGRGHHLRDVLDAAVARQPARAGLGHPEDRAQGGADDKLAELVGKPVYFEARDVDYMVREATVAEIAAREANARRMRHVEVPVADLAVDRAARRSTTCARPTSSTTARKASNLGEIVAAKLTGFERAAGLRRALPLLRRAHEGERARQAGRRDARRPGFARSRRAQAASSRRCARRSSTRRRPTSSARRSPRRCGALHRQ